ncbi:MAG: CocE/NonD family hydrolase [Mariniphaga sp.]|nr:CocE/NonD family hydrolase [Mariniphaga sp.]
MTYSTEKQNQLYTMGKNLWEYFNEWPPKKAKKMTMYLSSENGANTKFGDGALSQTEPIQNKHDEFIYDPANPVPSLGDNHWGYLAEMKSGSYDQSPVEIRQDVLVYSTPVLTEDLQITGPVEVILYLSSDVKDTDLTAKLVDVYPDGKAYNVAESIQRVRWREGYKKPVFMEEGNVYKMEIGPLLTSNQFKKEHQIRIEISSSNFPRFERNLNTGGNNYDKAAWEKATNRIITARSILREFLSTWLKRNKLRKLVDKNPNKSIFSNRMYSNKCKRVNRHNTWISGGKRHQVSPIQTTYPKEWI